MQSARSVVRVARQFSAWGRLLPGSLTAACLFGLAFTSPAVRAIPVLSPAANIALPATSTGLFINLMTGVSAATSATPGWDINPWVGASTGSAYIWTPSGAGVVSMPGSIANLAPGAVVGPGSSFSATGTPALFGTGAGQWTLNATNRFGFSFLGDDSALHYGYGTMVVGATALDRTLGSVWYESAPGVAITIAAVPEPSSWALLLAGGAAGAIAARRRRQS